MKNILNLIFSLVVLAFLCCPQLAKAQSQRNPCFYTTQNPGSGNGCIPVSSATPLPISGSFSATTAAFHPESSLTPITATTGGASSSSFTAGKGVLVQNTGSTNAAFCFPGTTATTSAEYVPAGGTALIQTTIETQITCSTTSSTTTLNLQVGTGLWAGAGGGSGGGSGGNVTIVGPLGQAVAGSSVPVVLPAAQITTLTPPTTVAVTQSTSPWIVNEAQINGVTPLMGNGISGTGSQRVNIASDNTAFQVKTLGNAGAIFDAATSASVPANALYMGMSNAGTMTGLVGDSTSGLWVNIKAGSSSGAVAQGSTTSGQTGGLTQCAATTSAPTYTTATTNPVSCDTAGNTRVLVSNTNANGQATMANSSPVVVASNQSAIATSGAVNVTATDCSGTVTTGGMAVNAFTAQTTLHGFTIVNTNTSEVMWISFTTTAAASTAGSYPIPAATATTFAGGGSFTSPPGFGLNHALSVVAATSAHSFSCTWW